MSFAVAALQTTVNNTLRRPKVRRRRRRLVLTRTKMGCRSQPAGGPQYRVSKRQTNTDNISISCRACGGGWYLPFHRSLPNWGMVKSRANQGLSSQPRTIESAAGWSVLLLLSTSQQRVIRFPPFQFSATHEHEHTRVAAETANRRPISMSAIQFNVVCCCCCCCDIVTYNQRFHRSTL